MLPRMLSLSLLALCLTGCSSWNSSKFDLSRLRDPRATDLDHRLSSRPEPVANPFGTTENVDE